MKERRWLNRYQVQTLVLANVLLYMEGVFNLVRGPVFVCLGCGMLLGGYAVANDRSWGWKLAVATSFLSALFKATLQSFGMGLIFSLIFPVALCILLIHPLSRQYQKIWFM